MSNIGWLPPKHSPFGTTQAAPQPQRAERNGGSGSKFAAFLNGDAQGKNRAEQTQESRGTSQSVPSSISQSAVNRDEAGAQVGLNSPTMLEDQASYRAAPDVSDNAIAFSARPIVGPASFSHTPETISAPINGIDSPEFAAMRAEIVGSFGIMDGHRVFNQYSNATPAGLFEPAATRTTPVPGYAIAATSGLQSAQVDAPGLAQIGSSSAKASAGQEQSTRAASRTANAAPIQSLQMWSAQNSAFAQLLASPSEYRVMIRGARLSEQQRDQVMRAVRSGLSEFGLPSKPLEVFEREGQR